MTDKLKVKFLTAIWGARYIKEFARVSLPSYLAEGNLPHLASEADLEIVILTSQASVPQFDAEEIFAKVRALCPLRFIFIDDLITSGNYGVTLTLAYARGITDSGPEQTNTHFVFMNADFVLADGALRTMLAKMHDGHGCIMAPSLRATAETTFPALAKAVDKVSHTLTMSPRRMVQLAFDNLHPTVVGKTVTQDLITCDTHNQIYWQVDRTTLLVRHYLIFMLAIKPEQPLRMINSYCDYGFVPELVPSGRFMILNDSDDFFMLELQPAAQEREYLRPGKSTPNQIAQRLAVWTTREHRRFAEADIVFHSQDVPADLDRSRSDAAHYVAAVNKLLPRTPTDHVEHRYWKFGVRAWALSKFGLNFNPGAFPPELTRYERAAHRKSIPLIAKVRKKLTDTYLVFVGRMKLAAGLMPNVSLWSHLWLDSQLVLDWIDTVNRQVNSRNLLVCKTPSPLAVSLPKFATFDACVDPEALAAHIDSLKSGSTEGCVERYDSIFVHIRRTELPRARSLIDRAVGLLKPDGSLAVHFLDEDAELDHTSMANEMADDVAQILPTGWLGYQVQARFAGGWMKRWLRKGERNLFRYLLPASIARLPHFAVALAVWPVFAGLTAANNLRMRYVSVNMPTFCSSALLVLTKKPQPPGAQP